MTDSDEGPVLGRVYRCTVQRICCNLKLFSSYATYILISDNSRKIYIWVGRSSSLEDTVLAESVAFDILRDDYQNLGEILTIKEGMEHQQKLTSMLDKLFMKIEDYIEYASLRLASVENSPITLSIIERKKTNRHAVDYVLKPLYHSSVSRAGSVAPLPFLTILDRKTIAILTTGNQYDIWFAEAVSRREKVAVKAYIVEMAMYKVPLQQRGMQSALFERSLCLVGQERSTSLFRESFISTTRHLISSNTKIRPVAIKRRSLSSTNSKGSQQKCSDCVGDAILRLLGISSKPVPTPSSSSASSRMTTNYSSSGCMDDETESTVSETSSENNVFCSSDALSSAFSPSVPLATTSASSTTLVNCLAQSSSQPEAVRPPSTARTACDMIFLRLQRLASRTEILFINQPRRNTKLLVLDLDHTLMDFSCRFDYMVEHLKRPFLDAFLAQSYLYYDIAVWSQTNFKWLELKLTELGMLNRRDYKICFALDKSTMFTVRQQYVKPLEIIWAKCASLGWGPHNTVHVDDLERNFELNKQSGVLISPFHLKPFTVHACQSQDGESALDGTAQTSSPATVINDFEGSPLDNAESPMHSPRERETQAQVEAEAERERERQGDSNRVDLPDECDDDPESRPGPLSRPLSERGPRSGSADLDDVARNKSFEDIELQLLSRYLVYIAVTVSDFSDVDHSLWRSRALEMSNDM